MENSSNPNPQSPNNQGQASLNQTPKKKKAPIVLIVVLILVVLGVLGEVGYLFYSKQQKTKLVKEFVQIEANDLSNITEKVNALLTEEVLEEEEGKELEDVIGQYEEEIERIDEALTAIKDAKEMQVKAKDDRTVKLNNEINTYYDDLENNLNKYKEFSEYNLQGAEFSKPLSDDLMVLMTIFQKINTNTQITDAELDTAFNNAKKSFNKAATDIASMDVPEEFKKKHEVTVKQLEEMAQYATLMADYFNAGQYEKSGETFAMMVIMIQQFDNNEDQKLKEEAYEDVLNEFERLNNQTKELENKLDLLKQEVQGTMQKIEIEDWT